MFLTLSQKTQQAQDDVKGEVVVSNLVRGTTKCLWSEDLSERVGE